MGRYEEIKGDFVYNSRYGDISIWRWFIFRLEHRDGTLHILWAFACLFFMLSWNNKTDGLMTQSCHCGRRLEYKWGVPTSSTHQQECFIPPKKRKRVGRWSGTSKRYRGAYERY